MWTTILPCLLPLASCLLPLASCLMPVWLNQREWRIYEEGAGREVEQFEE